MNTLHWLMMTARRWSLSAP